MMRFVKPTDGSPTKGYRGVFRDREFTGLFVADVMSRTGSQLGKFALAALVYDQTNSPALAAATFAVSYLPGVIGGPFLSTLADRLPRRRLLVSCDVARGVLTAVIALGQPRVEVALGLLLLVEFFRVPFGAARMAILADVLPGDRFAAGNALVATSQQVVQVAGFAAGGFVVAFVGAQPSLLLNAVTYALSAALLVTFVLRRPAPVPTDGHRPHLLRDTWEGLRVVRDTDRLPTLLWLLFLGPTVLATAEGLAIPLAEDLGLGHQAAGMFLAAAPLGSAVGLLVVGRLSEHQRERILIPFSVGVGVCVAAAGLAPLPLLVIAELVLAGVAMGHVAHLQATIVGVVAQEARGRVIGFANTLLQVGQALALLLAGMVAEATSSRTVLVCSGVAASAAVCAVALLGSPHGRRGKRARPHGVVQAGAPPSPLPERGPASADSVASGQSLDRDAGPVETQPEREPIPAEARDEPRTERPSQRRTGRPTSARRRRSTRRTAESDGSGRRTALG